MGCVKLKVAMPSKTGVLNSGICGLFPRPACCVCLDSLLEHSDLASMLRETVGDTLVLFPTQQLWNST